MIKVRKHSGHSGKSVYAWRVYHIVKRPGQTITTQLGKYRTQEQAEAAATHYRNNAERVTHVNAAFAARKEQ